MITVPDLTDRPAKTVVFTLSDTMRAVSIDYKWWVLERWNSDRLRFDGVALLTDFGLYDVSQMFPRPLRLVDGKWTRKDDDD